MRLKRVRMAEPNLTFAMPGLFVKSWMSLIGDNGIAMANVPENRVSSGVSASTAHHEGAAHRQGSRIGYRFLKRAFDIVFSACVIVVGAVPAAILAVAVARDTGGSPIYSQERVGRGGRPFRLYKFRTMVADADDVERHLDEAQLEQWRRERKVDSDPRVTPLGRVLRRASVDEFPQFANALLGQMSVVGPRAITRGELEGWYAHAERERLLSVRPGITGLWQVGPRNECLFEDGRRQALELDYVGRASASLDLRLVARTLGAMVHGTGR